MPDDLPTTGTGEERPAPPVTPPVGDEAERLDQPAPGPPSWLATEEADEPDPPPARVEPPIIDRPASPPAAPPASTPTVSSPNPSPEPPSGLTPPPASAVPAASPVRPPQEMPIARPTPEPAMPPRVTPPNVRPSGPSPSPSPSPSAEAPRAEVAEPIAPTRPDPVSGGRKVRARKVRRVLRHIEPWSVLKISVMFYAALFLIICVASGILWGVARAAGTVDNVESFITSVGGFGNCEPIDGTTGVSTTVPPAVSPDQLDPSASEPVGPDPGEPGAASPGDETDCRDGDRLVGEFKFEDARIFAAFILGGVVLILAGSAANVVMVLLFNLMSDLTGGVRVTVLEEDPAPKVRSASGSPPTRPRD